MKKSIITKPFISCLAAVFILGGCLEAKQMESERPGDNPTQPDKDTEEQEPAKPENKVYKVSGTEDFTNLEKINPGDEIIWTDGTYPDVKIKMIAQGCEGKPVKLRAEHPGKVVFTGSSSLTLQGEWLEAEGFVFNNLSTSSKAVPMTFAKGSSNCSFRQCKIDGTGSAVSETDSKWVSLYGRNNEVSNCTFIDKRNMGCLLVVWLEDGITPEHVIKNNFFTRPYTHYDADGKAKNSQESIRIGDSTHSMQESGCSVEGNVFYRCDGEQAEIISNKSCGNVYSGNLFEESAGSLTLRHGNRCTVSENLFVCKDKSNTGGIRIIGEGHIVEKNTVIECAGAGYTSAICLVRGEPDAALNGYWQVKDAIVQDNLIIVCKHGITVNYSGRQTQKLAPENVTFRNNTIISPDKGIAVEVIDTDKSQMRWLLNTIYNGQCKGIDLEMTTQKPEIPDWEMQAKGIRASAGVSY